MRSARLHLVSKPSRRRGSCAFCGAHGQLTREDFTPQWLGRFIAGRWPAQGPLELVAISGGGDRPYREEKRVVGNASAVKPAIVCQRCNNEWMKRLEDAAIPILKPMILGDSLVLDVPALHALASWAMKTALVFELIRRDNETTASVDDRKSFRNHRVPLPGARIWAGRYVGTLGAAWQSRSTLVTYDLDNPLSVPAPHGFVVVLAYGELALRVAMTRTMPLLPTRFAVSQGEHLPTIWPRSEPLTWPPAVRAGRRCTSRVRESAPARRRRGGAHTLRTSKAAMTDPGSDGPNKERLVVVLGAGFSKAVNATMPLTDALGDAIREQLSPEDQARLPERRFDGTGGRFEEWLSYLAEEQPHLTEDRSLEARALFYRVTEALRSVLANRQLAALASAAPPWLYELLSVLHVQRATVLSLNYDNFVECGIESVRIPAPHSTRAISEEDLLEGLPPSAEPDGRFDDHLEALLELSVAPQMTPRADSFRLLKLHGSLSWYWSPGDATGATLQRWRLPGTFGHPIEDEAEDRRRVLPGRVPFIVPPAALKSEHLKSPIVRELWRRADESFRQASRVIFLGYSLPNADRSFGGMLADALRGSGTVVEVVDRAPNSVLERLVRLGIEGVPGVAGADDCIARWVTGEGDALAQRAVDALRHAELTGDELLYVAMRETVGVLSAEFDRDRLDVIVRIDQPGKVVAQPLTTKCLSDYLALARRVVVAIDDRTVPIIDFELNRQPVTARALLDQIQLLPAGRS